MKLFVCLIVYICLSHDLFVITLCLSFCPLINFLLSVFVLVCLFSSYMLFGFLKYVCSVCVYVCFSWFVCKFVFSYYKIDIVFVMMEFMFLIIIILLL